jgi:uncharacterized protein YuzE
MKRLDMRNKGEIVYDYENDILLFRTKDRDYLKSIEFENISIDIDMEGFITGMQVFDASKTFKLQKYALKHIRRFEFVSRYEDKVIAIQLTFTAMMRNKSLFNKGQDFIRETFDSRLSNSETVSSVAV